MQPKASHRTLPAGTRWGRIAALGLVGLVFAAIIWETSILLALGCRKNCDLPPTEKIVRGSLASYQLAYRLPIWGEALYRFFSVVGAWVIWPVWHWVVLVWEVSSALLYRVWYALVRAFVNLSWAFPSFLFAPLEGFFDGADEYVVACIKAAGKSLPELPFWVAVVICLVIAALVTLKLTARYYFRMAVIDMYNEVAKRVGEDCMARIAAMVFMACLVFVALMHAHVKEQIAA